MERNFEQEAEKQGWRPKETFVENGGDEGKWVDAKTFVERGESSAPILKSRLEKLERRQVHLESVNESLTKHHNRMLEKEQVRRQELMSQLEEARANAVAEGNAKAFKEADKQLKHLEKQQMEEPVQAQGNAVDPEIDAWLSENTWYSEDSHLQAMADGYADKLRKRNPNLKGRAFLEEVGEYVSGFVKTREGPKSKKREASEEEHVPTRERESPKSERTYANLPADAKRECNRLMSEIKGFTKDQFLEYYDWE